MPVWFEGEKKKHQQTKLGLYAFVEQINENLNYNPSRVMSDCLEI